MGSFSGNSVLESEKRKEKSRPDSGLGGSVRRIETWPEEGAIWQHMQLSPCGVGCGCSGAKTELHLPVSATPFSGCLKPPSLLAVIS